MYSFVYVLIRLNSLALKQHFFCILSIQTRLVSLISTLKNNIFLATIYAFSLWSLGIFRFSQNLSSAQFVRKIPTGAHLRAKFSHCLHSGKFYK